jgi:dodecin
MNPPIMTTALKVIEIMAQSDLGWEDAAQTAITEANKSLRDIRSIYIQDLSATVEHGRITAYRLNAKISYGMEANSRDHSVPA